MNAPAAPAVSVCIPAHRGTTFIGEAIDSVIRQTFRDFELVVIDDNSHDVMDQMVTEFRQGAPKSSTACGGCGPPTAC